MQSGMEMGLGVYNGNKVCQADGEGGIGVRV